METSVVKRFCVKSLDADDAPFVWFKIYCRLEGRGLLVEKFNLGSFLKTTPLSGDRYIHVSRDLSLNSPTSISPMASELSGDIQGTIESHNLAQYVSGEAWGGHSASITVSPI